MPTNGAGVNPLGVKQGLLRLGPLAAFCIWPARSIYQPAGIKRQNAWLANWGKILDPVPDLFCWLGFHYLHEFSVKKAHAYWLIFADKMMELFKGSKFKARTCKALPTKAR